MGIGPSLANISHNSLPRKGGTAPFDKVHCPVGSVFFFLVFHHMKVVSIGRDPGGNPHHVSDFLFRRIGTLWSCLLSRTTLQHICLFSSFHTVAHSGQHKSQRKSYRRKDRMSHPIAVKTFLFLFNFSACLGFPEYLHG